MHRLAAALTLVATGVSMPVAAAPALAARWADGPCTDNVGITVVIDFQELGGGVNVRCASGPVTSGLDALDKAGIVWEGTRRFPGFVCRIAGKPGPESESCGNTPPATAYWSYWLAPRGGSWCYSSVGAGNRTPPPGTIEGWSFASNKVSVDVPPPGLDPPAPIPGEAPNSLNGADCGSPSATPAAPAAPVAAPTVPPPVPTNASATPAAPTTPAVLAEPDSASTADSDPPRVASAANAGGAASTTSAASTATTGASTTTRPATSSTTPGGTSSIPSDSSTPSGGSTPPGTDDLGTVELGTVDLSDDGRGDGGFSPAAGLGLLIAAAVGGTSVWAARRRRGAPP
jgi:hypothetical protein